MNASPKFARLRTLTLTVALITSLAVPSSAASPKREKSSERRQGCSECVADLAHPKVVGLKIYNQREISEAGLNQILEVASRIWKPYGVDLEPSTSRDAIAVVVSRDTSADASDFRPAVLGDTLFTKGHATPYIHLWPGNAEALAIGSEMDGRPFTSRPPDERNAIVVRMLGVALAHELAHYLLDTANHSAVGLLRATISVNDLASPRPDHLRLSTKQQQLICLDSKPGQEGRLGITP
jgi:hypothetical protein